MAEDFRRVTVVGKQVSASNGRALADDAELEVDVSNVHLEKGTASIDSSDSTIIETNIDRSPAKELRSARRSVEVVLSSLLPKQRSNSTPGTLAVIDPTIIDPHVVSAGNSPVVPHLSNTGSSIINDVFTKISLLASSTTSSIASSSSSERKGSAGNAPTASGPSTTSFWRRQGKVPGTIKPVVRTLPPRFESSNSSSGPPSISTYMPKGTIKKTASGDQGMSSSGSSPDLASSELSAPDSPSSAHATGALTQDQATQQSNAYINTTVSHRNSHVSSLVDPDPGEGINITEHPDGSNSPNERLSRLNKFLRVLDSPVIDLDQLKKLSWKGIPPEVRPLTWKILLGYVPTNIERRDATLERKRKEYHDCIPQYFSLQEGQRTEYEEGIYRQISIDVPRTNPTVALFQQKKVQQILERILYIWAIRHPASGYVQGINDLATPFFTVFLSEYVDRVEDCIVSETDAATLAMVEADSYWCMSKLLDGIQDHYTFAQPGLQRMIYKLKELVLRIDAPLARHLEAQDVQYLQFAFRWMNCLLMREMPLPLVVRMWDTYLSEGPAEGFGTFHVYVCAAFLVIWSDELRQKDFQEVMLFLQHLPTHHWKAQEIEMLVSQAYMWMTLFQGAPSHLKSSSLANNGIM